MVKTVLIEIICIEARLFIKEKRRTFRDYNRVGASLRDSPIHGETGPKEYGDLLSPRTLEVLHRIGSNGQQPR